MANASVRRLVKMAIVLSAPALLAAQCNEASLSISNAAPYASTIGLLTTFTFTVTNAGGMGATLGAVSDEGLGLAAPFSLTGGTCVSGGTVAGFGGTCTLEVSFSPTSIGAAVDTIELSYNWLDSGIAGRVASRLIEGTGNAPIADTAGHSFGFKPVGTTAALLFTIANSSGYEVTLGDMRNEGLGLAAPFSRTGGTCTTGSVLAPKIGSCSVIVTFSPTAIGLASDSIDVDYNWLNSGLAKATAHRPIQGTATAPLVISGGSAFWGPTLVGDPLTETFTVTNSGGFTATLGAIDTAGLGLAAPFSLSGGSCQSGQILPALGGTCTLTVAFTPTASGTASDSIDLSYQWPNGPSQLASMAITGTTAQIDSSDCFRTGCAPGHVCWEITSTESGAGTCVEVPPPPADCMAPCVWEARKKCLPVMNECREDFSYTSTGTTIALCDPRTHWSVLRYPSGYLQTTWEYRRDASACFLQRSQGIYDQNFGFVFYSDGTQAIAGGAVSIPGGPVTVACGPYTTISDLQYVPPQETLYSEINSPACLDWKSTYLGLTECRTRVSGSCQGL